MLYRTSNCSLLPEMSPLHVSVMKAEQFMRYRMHKCLVAKLWLLADSFQVSRRLILILFTWNTALVKQDCHFKQSPATTPSSAILLEQHGHFLRGFSFPSSPHPCIQKFPFLSFFPATPNSPSPTAVAIQTRWFSFLSRRLSEKLHLSQSPKLCHSESKWLRWKLHFLQCAASGAQLLCWMKYQVNSSVEQLKFSPK